MDLTPEWTCVVCGGHGMPAVRTVFRLTRVVGIFVHMDCVGGETIGDRHERATRLLLTWVWVRKRIAEQVTWSEGRA